MCKSCDIKLVQDAGGVFDTGGNVYGDVGGTKGYIYSSSCDFLVYLVRYHNFDSYPAVCGLTIPKMARPASCTTTRHLRNENPRAKIWGLQFGEFTTLVGAYASHTTFTAQTSCISERTE